MNENNIDIKNVIVHAPYIVNLANDENKEKYLFAINFLKEEIKRVEKMGVKKIVLHPGSYTTLDIERGIKAPSITTAIRLANVLNMSLDTMFADSLTIPANEVADVYLTDKQLAVLKKMVKEFRDNFME